jgi:hypothetical protein
MMQACARFMQLTLRAVDVLRDHVWRSDDRARGISRVSEQMRGSGWRLHAEGMCADAAGQRLQPRGRSPDPLSSQGAGPRSTIVSSSLARVAAVIPRSERLPVIGIHPRRVVALASRSPAEFARSPIRRRERAAVSAQPDR